MSDRPGGTRTTRPLELDHDTMQRMGRQVADAVAAHLASLRDQPAFTTLDRPVARALLDREPPRAGTDFDEVLRTFTGTIAPHHAREPHPRFLGYIPSCPTFPAVMGDWLATGYNFFAGVWAVAAGPNEVELTVLDWFRGWMGMPEGAGGLLTSGGSAATVTAVVAARDAALRGGPRSIGDLVAYCSDQAHSSFMKAAWIAGIPRANIRAIASDQEFRMQPAALRDAVRKDRDERLHPFLVCATAGATNTGAVDPLHEIADIAAEQLLWMHTDSAYAGFSVLTARGKALLDGIGRSDTLTLDPHKWLYVPFECGCLLAKDPAALAAAFNVQPEYLRDVQGRDAEVNFSDYGEQLTRYSRAMKVWFSVSHYGTDAIAAEQDRAMSLAEEAESIVRAAPELEVLTRAQFGIICFRVHPKGMDDPGALERLNDEVNRRVNATGFVLMSSTRLRGVLSLRLCIPGYRTSSQDVREVLELVRRTAADVLKDGW